MTFLKLSKTIFFYLLFLIPVAGIAQTVTWDGGGNGSSWSDPDNWSNDQVPSDFSEVLILSGSSVFISSSSAVAGSVHVENEASLTLYSKASLRFSAAINDVLLLNEGTIENEGILTFEATCDNAILNRRVFVNTGQIWIRNVNEEGILNENNFINYASGQITIDGSESVELENRTGIFRNYGRIEFRDNNGAAGIRNYALIINETAGSIIFSSTHAGHIECHDAGFRNKGLIDMSASAFSFNKILLNGSSIFNNQRDGILNIAHASRESIKLFGDPQLNATAVLNNRGIINIQANPVGGSIGIRLVRAAKFTQFNIGSCTIFGTVEGIVLEPSGDCAFKNSGELDVFSRGAGIRSRGMIENKIGGNMFIHDGVLGLNLEDFSSFINLGNLQLSSNNDISIRNKGKFLNGKSGVISGEAKIENGKHSFLNEGWIEYLVDGNNHVDVSSTIENYGMIIDPHLRFGDNIQNEKMIIIPLHAPKISEPYEKTFKVADNTYVEIGKFYLDAGLQNGAGSYDINSNTTYLEAEALGADFLYTHVEFGNFSKIVEVPVIKSVQALIGNTDPFSQSIDINAIPATDADLNVFPNPSAGLLNIDLSKLNYENATIQIHDLHGRLLWEANEIQGAKFQSNLQNILNPGMYLVKVIASAINSNGKELFQTHTRKLMIQSN